MKTKLVYAKDLTPQERRDYIEEHDNYGCSWFQDAIRKSEVEFHHVSIDYLSDRKIARPGFCEEGYFG